MLAALGQHEDARAVLADYVDQPVHQSHAYHLAEYLPGIGHADLVPRVRARDPKLNEVNARIRRKSIDHVHVAAIRSVPPGSADAGSYDRRTWCRSGGHRFAIGRLICQSDLVVSRLVPWIGSSQRSASVNPTLSSTRREAVFHSQTVAHTRSNPDVLAQSNTALEASVAYP
jgi:hypothetical protein